MTKLPQSVLLLSVVLSSCTALSDPCGSALPVIVASQSRLDDVQRALADIDASGIRDAIQDPKARQQFEDALIAVRRGHAIAVQSIALAADACAVPDVSGAMRLIVEGWTIVRSFLALSGGGTGAIYVADPIVWIESEGK